MFFNILYSAIVSIVIIFVVHNIFNYFKNTLTTPKIKDLINKPRNEYDKIKSVINSDVDTIISENRGSDNDDTARTEMQSINKDVDHNNIKSELKDFFKQLNEEKKDSISFNPVNNNYDTLNSNSMNTMNTMNTIFTNF